jgi:hypothetical protein
MAVNSASILWVDAGAGQTITRINTQAGSSAIVGGIHAISNADWNQAWESLLQVNPAPVVLAAEYQPVIVRASFLFTTTAPGILVKLSVPSPDIAIFLSDGTTVDLSNANVVALATLCIGNLCNEAGDIVTALIAGYLGS